MTESCPRVRRMVAGEVMEPLRHCGYGFGRWNRSPPAGQQRRWCFADGLIKQLLSDRSAHDLGEQGRHRVAQLFVSRSSATDDVDVVGKGLEPRELSDAESTV